MEEYPRQSPMLIHRQKKIALMRLRLAAAVVNYRLPS
jgi:hypothetical protein